MPVTSIVICMAGVSPVMSITPLTGTLWPDRSICMANRAVVILRGCVLDHREELGAVDRRSGSARGRRGRGGSDAVGAELAGVAWGSVAVVSLEPSPQAASEDEGQGQGSDEGCPAKGQGAHGSSRAPRRRPPGADARTAGPSTQRCGKPNRAVASRESGTRNGTVADRQTMSCSPRPSGRNTSGGMTRQIITWRSRATQQAQRSAAAVDADHPEPGRELAERAAGEGHQHAPTRR